MSTSPRLAIPEPPVKVLNETGDPGKPCKSTVDASKNLQKLMLKMKGEVISEDGRGVKYKELQKSPLFEQYKEQAAGLRTIKLDELNEDQRKAFFINIYNALTIHGLSSCEHLPSSVLQVQLFWKTTAYNIGGHVYHLDDIEHGILRGNRPHPASKVNPFEAADPRLKYVCKKRDPRIHFALVCGAKSCPAINVFTAENLDKALDGATRSFCDQEISIWTVQKRINVSQLFQWYGSDFGQNDIEAIRWTLPYLDKDKERDLSIMLDILEKTGMVDINYKTYDWNLNNWSDDGPPPPYSPPGQNPHPTPPQRQHSGGDKTRPSSGPLPQRQHSGGDKTRPGSGPPAQRQKSGGDRPGSGGKVHHSDRPHSGGKKGAIC